MPLQLDDVVGLMHELRESIQSTLTESRARVEQKLESALADIRAIVDRHERRVGVAESKVEAMRQDVELLKKRQRVAFTIWSGTAAAVAGIVGLMAHKIWDWIRHP